MTINLEKYTFERDRWLAVYGAMVAVQVQEHISEGRGGADEETFRRFIEEASGVADIQHGLCGKPGSGFGWPVNEEHAKEQAEIDETNTKLAAVIAGFGGVP